MKDLQSAAKLHREYRMRLDNETQVFSDLRTAFPLRSFPKCAARVWKLAVLAEAWGAIATRLSRDKKNYLDQWRSGQ